MEIQNIRWYFRPASIMTRTPPSSSNSKRTWVAALLAASEGSSRGYWKMERKEMERGRCEGGNEV